VAMGINLVTILARATKSGERAGLEKTERKPVYAEPGTTDTKTAEITFGGEDYIVPKTTGGLL